MNATGTQPGLADREALTLALQNILCGYPYIVEVDFGVPFAVVVTGTCL